MINFTAKKRHFQGVTEAFMSLDNIQMPSILIQELYKRTLVSLDDSKTEPTVDNKLQWPILGKNKKKVLLLINQKATAFLSDPDLNFLLGILSACQLSMEDVALVNAAHAEKLAYENIMSLLSPSKIIFFGIEPYELSFPLQFPHYKVQPYNNQQYLSAPALSVLSADKEQKMLLWNCLKMMFAI